MSAQASDPNESARPSTRQTILSTVPLSLSPHPLTVAEYLEIGDIEPGRTELVEGRLTIVPGATADHNHGGLELAVALRTQLPAALEVLPDMDIDLQLAPADGPGTVRRPDLVVVARTARARVRQEGGVLLASEVVVAVEILSPGSRRTDHVTKRGEYADAGIPHYWIVDLAEPVSLLACHLAGGFGYADGGVVTGRYSAATPFSVEIDPTALS